MHYLASQRPKLVRFVDNGHYPLDNSACENAIRPFAGEIRAAALRAGAARASRGLAGCVVIGVLRRLDRRASGQVRID